MMTTATRSLIAARERYPAPAFHPILITEVTRMLADHFCIAGYDLHAGRTVRPLRRRAQNWVFDEFQPPFAPGQLVDAKAVRPLAHGVLPHVREDIIADAGMDVLETWSEAEVLRAMVQNAAGAISALLGRVPDENRYLIEGTDCPSLGAVRTVRSAIKFVPSSGGRAKLAYWDSDKQVYTLPVTCHRLRTWLERDGEERGARRGNTWLLAMPARDPIVLRVGLTRGYAGDHGEYEPKRCFLQVNGILCAQPIPEA